MFRGPPYTTSGELTYGSDPSTDFYAWWLKRLVLAQGCAFWGIFHIAPDLGCQKPKTFGREYAFSSQTRKIEKRAYCQNYNIDSNQSLHSDKDHQMPFVGNPDTRITNPRWRTAAILEKSNNRYISASAAVWAILTKFGLETQIDPLDRLDRDDIFLWYGG